MGGVPEGTRGVNYGGTLEAILEDITREPANKVIPDRIVGVILELKLTFLEQFHEEYPKILQQLSETIMEQLQKDSLKEFRKKILDSDNQMFHSMIKWWPYACLPPFHLIRSLIDWGSTIERAGETPEVF